MRLEKWFRNQYYLKLLVSIVTFSMAIVIGLSIIFSDIYSKSLSEQMGDEYKTNISKMNVGFENLCKEIDQLYLLLQMNIDIYTFLNQNTNDDMAKMKASFKVNQLYQINPYIDSIVLYNTRTRDYSLAGSQNFDPMATIKKVLDTTYKHPGIKTFYFNSIKLVDDPSGAQERDLISLVYTELSSNKKNIESIVIINLNKYLVQNGILEKSNGTTLVFSDNGTEITNSGSKSTLADINISNEKVYNFVKEQKNELDSVHAKIDNEELVITYYNNSVLGLCLINVCSYQGLVQNLQRKRDAVIFIGLIVLLACLLTGYLISKMLYSPIKTIINKLKHTKYADKLQKKGDITLISEVYEEVLKDVMNLEKKNEAYLPKIKEDFLRNILQNGKNEADVSKRIADFLVRIQFTNLFIIVIKINNDKNSDERKLLYESTTTISSLMLLKDCFYCEAVNMFGGEICLMLNFIDKKNNDFETLLSRLEKVRIVLAKMLGENITIGIGGVANSPEECPEAFYKAIDMVKHRFVLGHNQVIYQRLIDENLTTSQNYPEEIEKKLIVAINKNNREEFIRNIQNFINVLKNYIYQDSVVIFLQVALECIRAMNQVVSGFRSLKVDFDDFSLMFGRLQTLDQVKSWMIGIFDEYQALQREIDSVKDNKYYEMVEETKRFIDRNYTDINLGVEMLAIKTGYTPNYFAKIFKSITKQYVNDYIKQVRITKAKELLKDTDFSINEISNMIGFINTTYFYSAFKKEVGLTPATYRSFKNSEGEVFD